MLQSRNVGPYKLIKKISVSAHVLELAKEMGISPIFNVEDLTKYYGHDDDANQDDVTTWLPNFPVAKDDIEDIVDHRIVSTRTGEYSMFLLKW